LAGRCIGAEQLSHFAKVFYTPDIDGRKKEGVTFKMKVGIGKRGDDRPALHIHLPAPPVLRRNLIAGVDNFLSVLNQYGKDPVILLTGNKDAVLVYTHGFLSFDTVYLESTYPVIEPKT
jgi:hypothetical protein